MSYDPFKGSIVENHAPGVFGACDQCKLLVQVNHKTCTVCQGDLQLEDLSFAQWNYQTLKQRQASEAWHEARKQGRELLSKKLKLQKVPLIKFQHLLITFGKKYLKPNGLHYPNELVPWFEALWGTKQGTAEIITNEVLELQTEIKNDDELWKRVVGFECKRHKYLYTDTRIYVGDFLEAIKVGSPKIIEILGESPDERNQNLRVLWEENFDKFLQAISAGCEVAKLPNVIPGWNEDRGTVNSWYNYNKYGGH